MKNPIEFGHVLRPKFTDGVKFGTSKYFPKSLIENCWTENSVQRPTIQTVRDIVERETKQ